MPLARSRWLILGLACARRLATLGVGFGVAVGALGRARTFAIEPFWLAGGKRMTSHASLGPRENRDGSGFSLGIPVRAGVLSSSRLLSSQRRAVVGVSQRRQCCRPWISRSRARGRHILCRAQRDLSAGICQSEIARISTTRNIGLVGFSPEMNSSACASIAIAR